MKLTCINCGETVDAGKGLPVWNDPDTIEYTYECPECGHRGAEYTWIENYKRIFSTSERPD